MVSLEIDTYYLLICVKVIFGLSFSHFHFKVKCVISVALAQTLFEVPNHNTREFGESRTVYPSNGGWAII